MEIKSYIESGKLELYAMNQLSEADSKEVELMFSIYPELLAEVTKIQSAIENYAFQLAKKPDPSTKLNLFTKLYKIDAGAGRAYPPYIEKGTSFDEIMNWVKEQELDAPTEAVDMHMQPIKENNAVINFFAWVKDGHPLETHDEYLEYIVVLEGSCTMVFDGVESHFNQGEIIAIPLHVPHQAIVTSAKPMFAMVQRQLLSL